jgi:hypothetical protein
MSGIEKEGESGEAGEAGLRAPTNCPLPGFVRPKPGRPKPKGEVEQQQPPTKAGQPQPSQSTPPTPNQKKRGRKPGSFTRNKKHLAARLKKEHDAREAYRLRYIEGKTLKEIAEALNRKSQGQLHTLIEEEKRRLRGAFTEDALDAFKFAKYEAVSLYGEARDNYQLTGDPKHAAIANQALDKIIKLTVGYLPEETNVSGKIDHEHQGSIDVRAIRAELESNADYQEFLRRRALQRNGHASDLCGNGHGRPLEDGSALGLPGPGIN